MGMDKKGRTGVRIEVETRPQIAITPSLMRLHLLEVRTISLPTNLQIAITICLRTQTTRQLEAPTVWKNITTNHKPQDRRQASLSL